MHTIIRNEIIKTCMFVLVIVPDRFVFMGLCGHSGAVCNCLYHRFMATRWRSSSFAFSGVVCKMT